MKKVIIILSAAFLLILFALMAYFLTMNIHKKYDYPLNTIETTKYYDPAYECYFYRGITLTPTEYRRTMTTNTLIAKAIYKGDTVGIKIEVVDIDNEWGIGFKSIGKESDNFVKALEEIYDANVCENATMRSEIKGRDWFWYNVKPFENYLKNWHLHNCLYTLTVINIGRVYLDIMIPSEQTITIDSDNSEELVNFFRESKLN